MYYRILQKTIVILSVLTITAYCSRISIKDNGYSDIVVAISPNVPSDQSQLIIENIQVNIRSNSIGNLILIFSLIQSMIRDASRVLYRATRYRAYFENVNILIPSSWTNVRAKPSTWEVYSVS